MNAPDPHLSDAAFRASVVGASEAAALFDASPWVTRFELFHRKVGNVDVPEFNPTAIDGTPENERADWGIRLEPVIIDAACERWGYRPLETPARLDNGAGLGGHPDKIVMCPERGRGILEVKCVDRMIAKQWGDEPPLHYLIQSLAYQGLAEAKWGDVIVLVGGNELRRYKYEFRPVIYADIEARVVEFWRSIEENKPPKPDYTRDGSTLAELVANPDDTIIDLRRDNRAYELCAEYLDAHQAEKAASGRKDVAKAELMEKLGTNAAALIDGYKLSAPLIAGSTFQVTRKPSRRLTVKEAKA